MKQSITTYPYFVANQVLKSKSLNDAFQYTVEQERITRSLLLGKGILSGLDYTYLDGTLTIKPGEAITNNGWFMEVASDTEYKYAVEVTLSSAPFKSDALFSLLKDGGSRVAYVCCKTYEDALEFHHDPKLIKEIDLSHYLLALVCGIRNRTNSICTDGSCDINLTQKDCEVWPILVNYTQPLEGEEFPASGFTVEPLFKPVSAFTLTTTSTATSYEDHRINLQRVSGIGKTQYLSVYKSKIREVFENNKAEIIRVGKYVNSNILGQDNYTDCFKFKTSIWDTILSNPKDTLSRFRDSLQKVNSLSSDKADIIPDYFLSFLVDYTQALKEFIVEYNKCVDKYNYLPYYIPEDNLIYLGDLRSLFPNGSHAGNHYYRSYFLKGIDEERTIFYSRLEKFLKRIILLSERFIGSNCNESSSNAYSARFVTGKPGSRISDRPIPFYYNTAVSSLEFFNYYWRADYDTSYVDIKDYVDVPAITDYNASVNYEVDGEDALYLMGINNLSAKKLLSDLHEFCDKEDLDLTINVINYVTNNKTKDFLSSALANKEETISALTKYKDSLTESTTKTEVEKVILAYKELTHNISESSDSRFRKYSALKRSVSSIGTRREFKNGIRSIRNAKTEASLSEVELKRVTELFKNIIEVSEEEIPGLCLNGPIHKGGSLYILTNGNDKVIGYATKK